MRVLLTFLDEKDCGKVRGFLTLPIEIGRSGSSHLTFDSATHPMVSHHHARIELDGESFQIVDLGSTNGTWVNQKSVRKKVLKSGDVLQFGRDGPRVTFGFELGPISSYLPEGQLQEIGAATARLLIQRALARSTDLPPPPGGDRGGSFVREIVKEAARDSSLWLKLFGLSTVFLFLVIAGLLSLFSSRYESLRREVAQVKDKERNWQRAMRDEGDELQKELFLLLATRDQERSQKEKGEVSALLDKVRNTYRPAEQRFYDILCRYERAIVYVHSEIHTKRRDGTRRLVTGSGTGFFITSTGYLVTNKHVVEPWKFGDVAAELAANGDEVDLDTQVVAVWPTGTVAFQEDKSPRFDTSYTNREKGKRKNTLRLIAAAPDHMVERTLPAGEFSPASTSTYLAHDAEDNNDLALLKAEGGPFTAVEAEPRDDTPFLNKLDPVMVLGFPRGNIILEKNRTEASPSLGWIRKVEDTIYVSASIIPGNSGGPLFNVEGRVIGVCTRIVTGTETLGICIKIHHVFDLVKEAGQPVPEAPLPSRPPGSPGGK